MAILFVDGVDHLATGDLMGKWTTLYGSFNCVGVSTTTAFSSGQSLNLNNAGRNDTTPFIQKVFPNRQTVVVGGRFMMSTSGTPWSSIPILWVLDNATSQVDVRLDGAWRPYLTRNGTQIGTTASVGIAFNVWNYFELKIFVHGSAGTAELRLNGTTVITVSGISTTASGNLYANALRLGSATSNGNTTRYDHYWDDLYLLEADSAIGAVDFLGDCRVQTLLPSGSGNFSGMTATVPVLQSAGASVAVIDTTAGAAANITDGNTSTFWRSQSDTNNTATFFYIDLGGATSIGAFSIYQDSTISGAMANQYKVEFSNNLSTWTLAYTSPNNLSGAVTERATILLTTPGTARYWRFSCMLGGGNDWVVFDCRLYRLDTTPNYLAVNEAQPDLTFSVSGNTVGQYDLYQYADLSPTTNRVYAVV